MPEDQLILIATQVDRNLDAIVTSTRTDLTMSAAARAMIAASRKLLDETAEIAEGYKPTMR